jgi:hypothetical protein
MRTQIIFCIVTSSADGLFDDGEDDRAYNDGGLTTPDPARLPPYCLAPISGLQFVLIASRDLGTSKSHIETLEVPITWQ